MPGGPKKHHSVYQFSRKRAKMGKKKRAYGTTSRVAANDQQAAISASAPDNGDAGDTGPLHKGTTTAEQVTRGVWASDIVSEGDSGSQDAGMPSRGSTSDQQATRSDAADGDPPKNDFILCTDSSRVRVDARSVTSSEIAQVSAREQDSLHRLESTPATTQKTAVFTCASDASSASAADPAAPCVMIDMEVLNELLAASLRCQVCGGWAKLVTSDRDCGLAKKMIVKCDCCGEVPTAWNSPSQWCQVLQCIRGKHFIHACDAQQWERSDSHERYFRGYGTVAAGAAQ